MLLNYLNDHKGILKELTRFKSGTTIEHHVIV